jgi:hypothetical protein
MTRSLLYVVLFPIGKRMTKISLGHSLFLQRKDLTSGYIENAAQEIDDSLRPALL